MKNIIDFIKECYKGDILDKIQIIYWIFVFVFSIFISLYFIFFGWWFFKIIGIIIFGFFCFAIGYFSYEDF